MLTYLQSNDLITQKQYVFCLKFLLGSSSIDVIYFDFCRGQRPAPIKLISLLLARQIALASTSIKLPSLWLSSIYTSDSTDVDYTQLLTTDDRRRRRTGPLLNSPIAAMDSSDLPPRPAIGLSAAIIAVGWLADWLVGPRLHSLLGDGRVHTEPGQFGSIKTSVRTVDKSSGKQPHRRGLPKSFADVSSTDEF